MVETPPGGRDPARWSRPRPVVEPVETRPPVVDPSVVEPVETRDPRPETRAPHPHPNGVPTHPCAPIHSSRSVLIYEDTCPQ
ncbi:hypothetical protein E3T49_12405 [Cryobacterium cryoconiti]|uniref:Uncharacterized protein n=1 Tax=Cryobacterium cryoconiti TaxID=1259239 RepID=A0A4Y8JYK7_9MICO|nr:hypothetical protein E3T49_12405 [Cryobacterium cryoconiti]